MSFKIITENTGLHGDRRSLFRMPLCLSTSNSTSPACISLQCGLNQLEEKPRLGCAGQSANLIGLIGIDMIERIRTLFYTPVHPLPVGPSVRSCLDPGTDHFPQ